MCALKHVAIWVFQGATDDVIKRAVSARRQAPLFLAFVLFIATACQSRPTVANGELATADGWWRGNTHTHTLWSDGDDFPEAVAGWYKRNSYHFLAITDHNTLATEERWFRIPPQVPGREAYAKYRERFGAAWVDERHSGDTLLVRLKRFPEYRARVEESDRFILVPGEEITQYLARKGAHMNALNIAEPVSEQQGATLIEMFRKDLDSLRAQELRTGREIVAVLNHPNFLWSQTAEDLLELPDLRFFEVYNGHPLVNILGDSLRPGTERIWDIVLTGRLTNGGGMLYGVATDDAHDYHTFAPGQRNPGRGWLMVRTSRLAADSLMRAMERGDFYASTGVTLSELRRDGPRVTLSIKGEPGVMYTTQFVGTRRGYDTVSFAMRDSAGLAVTRRYSSNVGAVLAEMRGTTATYAMRGDEIYVRARIVSSKPKANFSYSGEMEMAWTQPVRP
jgi:predicted metal-dependent phosphoesterase TrpH